MSRPAVPFPDRKTVPGLSPETERRLRRGVLDAVEARNRPILDALEQKVVMAFPDKTPLEDVLKYVRTATKGDGLPNGVAIFVDPDSISDPELTMRKVVVLKADDLALKQSLTLILRQVDLTWIIKDGMLVISAAVKNGPK